ncbi:ABC transporter permease [Microbacterium sp. 179-I 3D3 NHS]|uniref:ABC transporter permease n=1 Tax=unclassified Microbacterium TaxID=2609290 RepID=UPI0039A1C3C0
MTTTTHATMATTTIASGRRSRLMESPTARTTAFVLSLLVLLGLWLLVPVITAVPSYVIPPLPEVVSALTDPQAWPTYLTNLQATMTAVAIGFVIGVLIGLVLAIVLSEIPALYAVVFPYIVAIEAIPKVALAPLFVIWFGYGLPSKIVIVVLLVFFPVLVNAVHGLREVDPDRADLFRAAGASRTQIRLRLALPTALPSIFSGLELAVSGAMVGAIVGEFVGAQQGLGVMVLIAQSRLDTAGVFAILILLSTIGIALNLLVRFIRRRVVFWVAS